MPLDRLECGSNKSITHPVMMAASPATDQEEPFPCWLVEDKQHKGVGAPGGGRGWSVSDTLSLEPVKGVQVGTDREGQRGAPVLQ